MNTTEKRLHEIRQEKAEIRAMLKNRKEFSMEELDEIEERLNKLDEEEERLRKTLDTLEGIASGTANVRAVARFDREGRPFTPEVRTITNGLSYRSLFPHVEMHDGGFRSFGEWWRVVMSERHDPRLLEQRTHVSGVPELGGYVIPIQYIATIMDEVLQQSIILPRARVLPLTSLKVQIPAWDDLDQSDGKYYGGFKPLWIAEDSDQSGSEQVTKLRQIELHAHKLALYTSLTREVAFASRPDFETELRRALATSMRLGLDEAFILGDGDGKPAGIATGANPALVKVARQEAGKITYADLVNMVARLHPAAMSDAIWIANPGVLPQLLTMTAPDDSLVWQPSARDAMPSRLLGFPIEWFDRMPDVGETADLVLVNPRFYQVALGPSVAVESSTAPHWFKDRVALRAITLADGRSTWDKPYTPPNGTTRSWAVALDLPQE